MKKNILIFGAGYVGFSLSVVLARKHNVTVFEIQSEKIDKINAGVSPIEDRGIGDYLKDVVQAGNLRAKLFDTVDVISADVIILALPTNYDPKQKQFDTKYLDDAIEKIALIDPEKLIVIKSTIPVGYTENVKKQLGLSQCVYSPEFLREGRAIFDNLHPSRIVIGSSDEPAVAFAKMLEDASHERSVKIICTSNTTAELIKLSSNAYLAMRIAFFNEIDSYALMENLNAEDLITGICADPRIGEGYNNPSFSYGGYCLPKDVRQLQASFEMKGLVAPLLSSIHTSNENRLAWIIDEIERNASGTVGIFRLQMKQGSDNFREASSYRILKELLKRNNLRVILYEPTVQVPEEFQGLQIHSIEAFIQTADLIVANRGAAELETFEGKLFSRDIYNEN